RTSVGCFLGISESFHQKESGRKSGTVQTSLRLLERSAMHHTGAVRYTRSDVLAERWVTRCFIPAYISLAGFSMDVVKNAVSREVGPGQISIWIEYV
ncbi:hypothetical protein, partial [Cryobacterium sp. Y62]|uniref:hypothetical protein n=1 Tax=Cryobacterium sp. Y62 TaxID=2048284 RepID=UPI001E30E262